MSGFALIVVTCLLAGSAFGQGSAAGSAGAGGSQKPVDGSTRSANRDEFAQMDLDGDGRVSAQEYAASPRSAIDRIAKGKREGPAGVTGGFDLLNNEGRPERSKFFRKLDTNHDGFLSRSELGLPAAAQSETVKH